MKPLLSFLVGCHFLLAPAWTAEKPASSAADRLAVVDGNNAFAVDLYGQLRNRSGNLFFSPESISTALAMTYAGARGNTASQMARTLRFPLPPDRLHAAMGALLSDLNAAHDGYRLRVADALWAQQGYSFLDDFLTAMKGNYDAGFNMVDFKDATEAARKTINQWVEQRTENKIKDLLQPGVLTSKTTLVLTNATYFMGNWQTQFDKAQTRDEDFHVSPSQSAKAPLMHREGHFNYLDGGTFQGLEIPYKSNELSMIILLPKDGSGLPALEQSLTASNMKQWLGQLTPVPKVMVTIPKFNMTQQFGLKGALSAMGMPLAFEGGEADFSGMTGKRELALSAVIHKAYIDVDEEGTEAAAATGVVVSRAAVVAPIRMPPPVFRADHPFVFLIRDNRSSAILFMGRVIDPTSDK